MSCRPPLTLAGFGVFDGAKLQLFPDIERKKNPRQYKQARIIIGKYKLVSDYSVSFVIWSIIDFTKGMSSFTVSKTTSASTSK